MSQQTVAGPSGAWAAFGAYGTTGAGFAELTGPYRRELLAHCYRLLGSLDDAQDLVRETWLRAWGAYDAFEGRSSVRLWLYRIATDVCLDAIRRGTRRPLPSASGPASGPAIGPASGRLQPIPDALVLTEDGDPEAVAVPPESLRLALIAGLQCLPARQRAVLLLRDVLDFPAAEAAAVLGTSVEAVKSALQRARDNLHAASTGDAGTLRRLLGTAPGAALELPPPAAWFTGRGAPGDWRMLPTAANGQPAAAAYRRAPDGGYQGFGIAVLTTTAATTEAARVTVFADPTLLPAFALPAALP
jgi:RNA polymerase sigma-70 factor (ECF subfamily)